MALADFLLIGLGGAIGSMARGLISTLFATLSPWPTLFINLSGAFLIGLLVKLMENSTSPETFRAFWLIGICGGFTTFSAFSLEMLDFFRASQWASMLFYGLISVSGCIIATFLAFRLVSNFQA